MRFRGILHSRILVALGHGERDAAAAEAQLRHHFDVETALGHLVQAHYSQLRRSVGHHLRDVVVAQIEHLDGEIRRFGQEFAFGVVHLDTYFTQQCNALFVEPAFGLNSYS